MAFRPFNPLPSQGQEGGSALLDRIQQLLRETLDSLKSAVTNDRRQTVTLTDSVETKVYHGLGRAPTTIDVVNPRGLGIVFESSTPNDRRDQYVLMTCYTVQILTGETSVTCDLRFN